MSYKYFRSVSMLSPRNICVNSINVSLYVAANRSSVDRDHLNKACALIDHGLILTKQILIRERLAEEYLATSLHISV